MHIYIDADACPREVRQVVFNASARLSLPVVLVANSPFGTPESPLIQFVKAAAGSDEADALIAESVAAGDIVVTADVPLASAVVARGAVAIDPRGRVHDESNVGERLATRNLLSQLRDEGKVQGGPAPFGPADKRRFANALDRLLTKMLK